jgi:hypothetical protein
MNCTTARQGLWPPERPRLVGGDVASARTHVANCAECATYFSQDRALLDMYDRAQRISAPAPVRERVFDALALARWETRHGTKNATPRLLQTGAWPSAMIAALGVLAVVLVLEFRPPVATALEAPDVFVEDYLRRAVGQDYLETADPAEVTQFLNRELGVRLDPIRLAGLRLARVEICLLEGRRGAMIVYEKDGAEVSHYLVPRDGVEARAPALSDRFNMDPTTTPVVTWATPRVEQALVGDISSEALLLMAGRSSLRD